MLRLRRSEINPAGRRTCNDRQPRMERLLHAFSIGRSQSVFNAGPDR
jgi:hypothetical protein